ncbi:hypothetical protein [Bradyrhizobium genosp. P]|uniref:hypothetical protein n=1 Tax=Bradyrhizobium genosp. P TaxID=83641 RepID=UPI003CF0C993
MGDIDQVAASPNQTRPFHPSDCPPLRIEPDLGPASLPALSLAQPSDKYRLPHQNAVCN